MKRSLLTLSLAGLTFLSPTAFSDTILGVYAGVGIWQTDLEGSARETGTPNNLDINETFGSVEEDSNYLYVALEHPVPVIPNIMLQQTDASFDKSGTLNATVEIDDVTFTGATDVDGTVDFSHTDIVLYYELLDNWLNLDFGLTLRSFDGEFTVRTTSGPVQTASEDIDQTIPMLYLKGRFDLPFTGFYGTATAHYISISDASLTDFSAGLGYQTDGWVMDLGVEVGLRTFALELDDVEDFDADFDMSGAYAALTVHF